MPEEPEVFVFVTCSFCGRDLGSVSAEQAKLPIFCCTEHKKKAELFVCEKFKTKVVVNNG